MNEGRQINFRVNLDTGQVERQSKTAAQEIRNIGDEAEHQSKRMTEVFKAAATSIGAVFAIERVKGFISQIINVRSEIQALEVSFNTLLGSEQKAQQLIGEIRTFAASTPMQVNDLAAGAQTLLGFNIELEKVMPMMKAIGDISMGSKEKFNSLTLAFAQMSATGKLMGQDLLQMINAGFNPLTEISAKTGKSISQLKDEMSAGAISAQMVEDAFKSAAAEGGKFHGMLEQQSKTLGGALSNLQGAFTDMLNDFGQASEGILASGINTAWELVKNYREVGEVLMAVIGVLGTYKAAVIANAAIEAAAAEVAMRNQAAIVESTNTKIAAVAELNAVEATGLELEVQKAVAAGQLTEAQGAEIIAEHELAKARVADLRALHEKSAAEVQAALIAEGAAASRLQAAQAKVAAITEEIAALNAEGDAFKKVYLEEQLETAVAEQNAAAKEFQAAAQTTANAKRAEAVAATTAETAAEELNTLSVQTNTTATTFLGLAKEKLTAAVRKLYATMTAHPYALLAAAIAALGYGIYKLITYQTEAEKAQKRLNDAVAQAQGEIAAEEAEARALFDALKNAKKGTDEFKAAKDAIFAKYGGWLKKLGDENAVLADQAAAYALVAQRAREAAMAKAYAAFMEKEGAKYAEEMGDNYKAAYDLVVKKYGKAFADKNTDAIRRIVSGDSNVNKDFLNSFNQKSLRLTGSTITGDPQYSYVDTNPLQDIIDKGKRRTKQHNDMAHEAEIRFGKPKDPGPAAIPTTPTTTETTKKSKTSGKAKTSTSKNSGSGNEKTAEQIKAEREALLQDEADMELEQARQRGSALIEYDMELEQARINVMDDGAEKRRRQRELDTRKELSELRARMQAEIDQEIQMQKALFDAQEEINANNNKKYAKKTFSAGNILDGTLKPGDSLEGKDTGNIDEEGKIAIEAIMARYDVLETYIKAKRVKEIEDIEQAERDAMNEFLKDYGTYEEKKTAIAALYASRREKAITDAEKLKLYRDEQEALEEVEFDEFLKTKAALAFGEIDNLSQKTIADLIQQLEKFKEKATESFDPARIEKYNKALANLRRAQALNSGGLFSRFFEIDIKKKQRAAQAELNEAEKQHNDLLEKKKKKEQEVEDQINKIIKKAKELNDEDLTADDVKDGSTVSSIIDILNGRGDAKGATELQGLMDTLNKSRAELGGITEAADQAGVSFQNLREAFSGAFEGADGTLAMVGAIIQKVNEAVQETAALVRDLADTADALGADTEVGSGWDQATTFMDGFAEASQNATDAFEALKSGNPMGVIKGIVGSFTAWIRTFAALHDNAREKKIQELQKEIEELDRINKRIEHRLEKQYSKEANRSYEQEIQNLEKQRELIQEQIAAEQDKKKTDDDRIQEWKDQYEELGWQIEEYKDKALDAIIGEDISSSIDNFADALADSWGKTADRAKATKDYVKSMLRQMVLEAMKTDLSEPITRMRQMMADAMADDVVTDAEKKELEKFAQDLGQMIQNRYSWADDIIKDSTNGQSGATTGGFATASQDSIEELSGRAAAIHTSGEMRRELLMNIRVDLAGIREQMAQSRETSDEIRSLQLIAVGHLETIAKNTHELYEMNERLDKIERNTRNL